MADYAECEPRQMPLQTDKNECAAIRLIHLYNVYQNENPDALHPPCEASHCWVKRSRSRYGGDTRLRAASLG